MLDQGSPQRVEVIVFHLFVVFFDAPQSALEKSWWPEKARLFSARLDAKSRTDLDRFHYLREADRKARE